jgi:hypothetical protein
MRRRKRRSRLFRVGSSGPRKWMTKSCPPLARPFIAKGASEVLSAGTVGGFCVVARRKTHAFIVSERNVGLVAWRGSGEAGADQIARLNPRGARQRFGALAGVCSRVSQVEHDALPGVLFADHSPEYRSLQEAAKNGRRAVWQARPDFRSEERKQRLRRRPGKTVV